MSLEDGVIKFNCFWEETNQFTDVLLNELIQFRQSLYNKKLIGCYPNGIGYGNISMREKGKTFYISGSGTGDVEVFGTEHISLVTDFDLERNKLSCSGPVKASSESLTHAAIYLNLPSINAVIHVHSQTMWSKNLDILPTTDINIPYGTPEMAFEIGRLSKGEIKTIIMGGHEEGIICFGETMKEAYFEIEKLFQKEKLLIEREKS